MSQRPTMPATYESTCAWCDERILEGDSIALIEPDGDWAHEPCAEETPWEDAGQ